MTKLNIAASALALLGFALLASDAAGLSAAEKRGQVLSTRLCARCHAIGKTDASQRPAAIPFRRLGQRVSLDTFASRLRQGLMSGHHDMPEFRFSRDDAHAMVAYLRLIQSQ
jgi:cytochrome c